MTSVPTSICSQRYSNAKHSSTRIPKWRLIQPQTLNARACLLFAQHGAYWPARTKCRMSHPERKLDVQTVIVNTAPDTPSLYARTLAGLFKRSRNAQLPALRLVRPAAVLDPAMLARYASVCGFHPEHGVPLTAPHLLAFPLHMLLLTDPSFPWPALGLVHLANQIHQHQPLASGDALRLEVECGALVQHAKGQAFVVHARAYRRGAAVWDSESL